MTRTRIVELRQSQGWTQEKLADASGVGIRTIQRMEAGHDASLETLSLVASALRVPVRDLFDDLDSLDDIALSARVESVESRAAEQQASRTRTSGAWRWLFIGVGVVVTFVSFVLGATGAVVILAYWIGGTIIVMALRQLVLEPALDRRYPLSRSRADLRATARSGRSAVSVDDTPAVTSEVGQP